MMNWILGIPARYHTFMYLLSHQLIWQWPGGALNSQTSPKLHLPGEELRCSESHWSQCGVALAAKSVFSSNEKDVRFFSWQNLWMIIITGVCKRHGWRIVVVSYVMFFQVFERMRRCWNWCLFFLEMWISTGCPWMANSIHNVVHDEPRSSRNKRQPCLAGAMRHCLVCYKKGLVLSSESVK